MKRRTKISLVGIFICLNYTTAQDLLFKSATDLNSDNKVEEISLEPINDSYKFYLEISGQKVKGTFDDGAADGFIVIDVNTYDKYKEIAVHTPGPSDDDEYLIYWYDGDSIHEMAHLSRWPTFTGNGIVYVDGWMGFWTNRDKYVLNNETRQLQLVPQFAYYVGVKVTAKKSFPIYKDKDLKQQVALLNENSEIDIILCDAENREWNDYLYLIKSQSGLIGWTRYEELFENSEGFPLAD